MKKRVISLLLIIAVLCATCLTAFATDYSRVLKKDMSGEDVLYMQERLSYYEFYTGTLDGKFGTGMEKAVKAFQRKNNLNADGKIGMRTWAALEADDNLKKSDVVVKFASYRKGDTGEKIKDLQRALRETYYYGGTISGIFDTATVDA